MCPQQYLNPKNRTPPPIQKASPSHFGPPNTSEHIMHARPKSHLQTCCYIRSVDADPAKETPIRQLGLIMDHTQQLIKVKVRKSFTKGPSIYVHLMQDLATHWNFRYENKFETLIFAMSMFEAAFLVFNPPKKNKTFLGFEHNNSPFLTHYLTD